MFKPISSPAAGVPEQFRLTEADFVAAVERNQSILKTIAMRYANGRKAVAADMVQDALVKAWRFRHRFTQNDNLNAWLKHVAVNVFRNFLVYENRPHRGQALEFNPDLHGVRDPDVIPLRPAGQAAGEHFEGSIEHSRDLLLAVLSTKLDARVVEALRKCQPDYAHCLLLNYWGYTDQEIADMLGIRRGTVCSRIHRARKFLKESLKVYATEQYGIGAQAA